MIFYAPAPLELLENQDSRHIVNVQLPSGGSIRAEVIENNSIRVLDVISTDPMDFMNSSWQPGTLISLKPTL